MSKRVEESISTVEPMSCWQEFLDVRGVTDKKVWGLTSHTVQGYVVWCPYCRRRTIMDLDVHKFCPKCGKEVDFKPGHYLD